MRSHVNVGELGDVTILHALDVDFDDIFKPENYESIGFIVCSVGNTYTYPID